MLTLFVGFIVGILFALFLLFSTKFGEKIFGDYKDVDGLSDCCGALVVNRTEDICLNCSNKCKIKKNGCKNSE